MSGQPVDGAEPIELVNEFASVRVFKVRTHNGERLRIESERMGLSVDLDPLELESLTWQSPETFSGLLATPVGREGDDD